jgi:CheY-like chemotaxis protein
MSLETSSNYLKHLIENIIIFDSTKGNGDPITIKAEDFLLFEFLTFIRDKFYFLAFKSNINLLLDTNIDENIIVSGFKSAIDQVLSNFIVNAIKFSNPNQNVIIKADLLPQDNAPKISVKFSVIDQGQGMDDQTQSKIFDYKKRLDVNQEVNTKSMEGVGIGLSVSYNLLRQYLDSDLIINSRLNHGSTFSFIIEFDTPERLTSNTIKDYNQICKLNVLVIDDNKLTLLVTKKLFEKSGINCETCTDEDDVLNIISEKQINVVVVDINMPKINGYQMTQLIKVHNNIPVIAHTAGGDLTIKDDLVVNAGIDEVLIKPYTIDDFFQKLGNIKDKVSFD